MWIQRVECVCLVYKVDTGKAILSEKFFEKEWGIFLAIVFFSLFKGWFSTPYLWNLPEVPKSNPISICYFTRIQHCKSPLSFHPPRKHSLRTDTIRIQKLEKDPSRAKKWTSGRTVIDFFWHLVNLETFLSLWKRDIDLWGDSTFKELLITPTL